MRNVDPGDDTRDVFTFQIAPESDELKDAASFARFHLAFMERLRALPGVRSVGIVDNVPLNEDLSDDTFIPAERAGDSRGGVMLGFTSVAGDYFQTMGIRLLAGRALTDRISSRISVMCDQPLGGEPALARAVPDRSADQARERPGVGDGGRRGGGRDAGQLPRPGATGGLLPDGGPAARDGR